MRWRNAGGAAGQSRPPGPAPPWPYRHIRSSCESPPGPRRRRRRVPGSSRRRCERHGSTPAAPTPARAEAWPGGAPGTTTPERVGGQAEGELDSKENDRCHVASQIVSAWICLQVVTQAIFDGPPGLAFAHDLEDLLDLAVKRSIGLPSDAHLLHLLDVQVVVVTHLRRLLPWQS